MAFLPFHWPTGPPTYLADVLWSSSEIALGVAQLMTIFEGQGVREADCGSCNKFRIALTGRHVTLDPLNLHLQPS